MFRLMLRLSALLCAVMLVGFLLSRVAGAGRPREWLAFVAEDEGATDMFVADVPIDRVINVSAMLPNFDPLRYCFEYDPAWSNEGHLAFVSGCIPNSPEIFVVDFTNGDILNLAHHAEDQRWPSWSEDGQLAYVVKPGAGVDEIYIHDGEDITRVIPNEIIITPPIWMPNGEIIFAAHSYQANVDKTYLWQIDGTLLTLDVSLGVETALSTDGRLAYAWWNSGFDSDYEIYIYDFDDQSVTKAIDNSSNDSSPVWAPDGTLTFSAEEGSYPQIHMLDLQTGEQRNLHLNRKGEASPRWSPSGYLAFLCDLNGVSWRVCIRDLFGNTSNLGGYTSVTSLDWAR